MKGQNLKDFKIPLIILLISLLFIGCSQSKETPNNNNEEIKIAFSAKHMMDALRTINSKDVRILLNSEISPIILNTEDSDDLLQLLMPIKTY